LNPARFRSGIAVWHSVCTVGAYQSASGFGIVIAEHKLAAVPWCFQIDLRSDVKRFVIVVKKILIRLLVAHAEADADSTELLGVCRADVVKIICVVPPAEGAVNAEFWGFRRMSCRRIYHAAEGTVAVFRSSFRP